MTESPPFPMPGTASEGARAAQAADTGRSGPTGLLGWLMARLRRRNGEASVREAISELIDEHEDAGHDAIDQDERALIANILRLHEVTAEDVMVPRAEIVAVEASTPLEGLVERMAEKAHSRIPVYRTKLDDVIGFVHIKDVVAALREHDDRTVADLTREILFAAPSIQVLDLLLEMRASHIHMAIVVDEYGGVDGLISIEDLVEEIVGEIEDEHDTSGPPIVEQSDGSILADATARIEDLEKLVGSFASTAEREEIDTLGGIVFAVIDRVPRRAEVVVHPSGLEFEVVDADARRIKKLRILRPKTSS